VNSKYAWLLINLPRHSLKHRDLQNAQKATCYDTGVCWHACTCTHTNAHMHWGRPKRSMREQPAHSTWVTVV
jgi:hypothetical protein